MQRPDLSSETIDARLPPGTAAILAAAGAARSTCQSRVLQAPPVSTNDPASRGAARIAAIPEVPEQVASTGTGSAIRGVLLACLALAVVVAALVRVAHAEQLDDETRRIGKQLQCPVCAGASVADSPSDLAGQMRSVIRARLEAGENEDQIIAYFVERYGDGVLIEPPRRGIGLAVWLAPVGVLAVGGFLLWRILTAWLRPRSTPPSLVADSAPGVPYRNGTAHAESPAPVSTVDRARAELDRFRREG